MDKNTENNVEAYTGPCIIAYRTGKKGPGVQQACATNPDEAALIAAELQNHVPDGSHVIVRPLRENVVQTFDQWDSENKEKLAKIARRQQLLADMTEEDRKLVLGK